MKKQLCYIFLFFLVSCSSPEGLVTISHVDDVELTTISIRGAAYSTPIEVSPNEVVLGTHKRTIYFLTKDSIQSVYRTNLWVHATPSLVYDSLVSIGSYDGNFYFFNTSGELIKKIRPGARIFTNSVQLDSVWMCFASAMKGLWYYNFMSDSLFFAKIKKFTHGSPAQLTDGSVCLGSNDKKLYFFNNIGIELASFATHGWVMHSKALIQSDSSVVFGSYDNNLYSVSPQGNMWWKYATKGKIHASPQQFDNGNIICGSFDKHIYIVSNQGESVAIVPTDKRVVSSATIIDGTYAAVGSYDENLYIVDNQGNIVKRICLGGKIFSSPIVLQDGTIFCATTNGKAVFVKVGL